MSTDYNSELISNLYKSTNQKKVIEIIEEMEEIGDPIFLEPIYDAYKRFQHTYISHYFVNAFEKFDSPKVLEIVTRIINDGNRKLSDFFWTLSTLDKHKEYSPSLINIAGMFLKDFAEKGDKSTGISSDYELGETLRYLKNANSISVYEQELQQIIQNDSLDRETRSLALRYLLRIDSSRQFQYLIDEHPKIKGTDLEVIISKEITASGWKGGSVNKLKELILSGSGRARDIIEESVTKDKKLSEETEVKESLEYANSLMIADIAGLRNDINLISSSRVDIGFDLFPQSELLVLQQKVPKDEASLKSLCNDLRTVIQSTSEKLIDHGYSPEEITKLLPDTAERDFNKSLNRLFLFLNAKKIVVKRDLFGLRELVHFTSLVGPHPEERKELIKELKRQNLDEKYISKEWSEVHKYLLRKYKESLSKLKEALEKDK
ncbi:MAG: hypothetical protein Q7S60_02040 [bacterium]|nr:hypothetical protein [bacterium]